MMSKNDVKLKIADKNNARSLVVERDIEAIIKSLGEDVRSLEGKTLLISGSSGFLGNYFMAVFQYLNKTVFREPCKILAIDNHITGNRENILGKTEDENIIFKKYDVCLPLEVQGPVDYIIHMAGFASPVFYRKFPLETIRVATQGTQNLLELAKHKKSKRFLFFSSSEIYGDPHPDHIPTPETYKGNVSSIGPRACYDESKRLGETLCMSYYQLYGTPVQIIRPFNVYGPGMRPDDRRVIPQFLTCAMSGKPLPIHGNGLQTRSYCYIADAMVGFLKVLLSNSSGEVYNIGNHKTEVSLVGLANIVAGLFDRRTTATKIPYPDEYPSDEPSRRCPDITKAMKELRFFPEVDLRLGLEKTLSWYKENHVRLAEVFNNGENMNEQEQQAFLDSENRVMVNSRVKSLTIFFPCLNEKGTIATLVLEARKVARSLTNDFEIIVVDDGSTDGSKEVLFDLQNNVSELRLVFHEKNKGYGAAIRSGFKASTKDLVFYTDGDGQYDVNELPLLVKKLEDDVEVVNGYKMGRRDPVGRIVIGYIYQYSIGWLFWLPIRDVDCDFRLIRRKVLDKVDLKSDTGAITIELVKRIEKAGFKFAEAGVSHYNRTYGLSRFFTFSRIVKTLYRLIPLWFDLFLRKNKHEKKNFV